MRRYRKLLENGGPFPDLILIDGGKGQLAAAYEALESSAWATSSPSALPRRRSCSSRAISEDPHRAAGGQPGAAADPADPRRGASVRGDVPPGVAHEARSAVGARCDRRDRSAAAQGAADGVRQRRRRPPRHPRGAGARRRRQVRRRRARAFSTPSASHLSKRHRKGDCPLLAGFSLSLDAFLDSSSDQSFGSLHLQPDRVRDRARRR